MISYGLLSLSYFSYSCRHTLIVREEADLSLTREEITFSTERISRNNLNKRDRVNSKGFYSESPQRGELRRT